MKSFGTTSSYDATRPKPFAARPGKSAHRHEMYEDILAVLSGVLFISLGIVIFSQALILTGGISGVAMLLQHATGMDFGLLFFLFNLPFYCLAVTRMGWRFAARSLVAIVLVSIFTRLTGNRIGFTLINPVYAAVLGGLLLGMGLLMLLRHGTGLSGSTILALYLQERWGISAGMSLLLMDLQVLVSAALFLPTDRIVLSVLGAIVMNAFLAINHKPGRYIGLS